VACNAKLEAKQDDPGGIFNSLRLTNPHTGVRGRFTAYSAWFFTFFDHLNPSKVIEDKVITKERRRAFELGKTDCFRCRTRYFTDSGIIGSKEFVFTNYQRFKHLFYSKYEKKPKPIKGLAYESLRLVQNPGKKQIMFISVRKINTN
jgi:hypothetical protein